MLCVTLGLCVWVTDGDWDFDWDAVAVDDGVRDGDCEFEGVPLVLRVTLWLDVDVPVSLGVDDFVELGDCVWLGDWVSLAL